MKRRRSIAFTAVCMVSLSLCVFGGIKAFLTFDVPNGTLRAQAHEKVDYSSGDVVVKASITPPQPKNKNGRLVCTKDRYIQSEQQVGLASWYGNQFHGELTASGERFDEYGNTIAHLTLPMGTEVLVENPETGIVVYAKVNDCGPYVKDRIADLSYGIAKKLGLVDKGVGRVIITVL